jgi:hypothetical protein
VLAVAGRLAAPADALSSDARAALPEDFAVACAFRRFRLD